MSWEERQVMVSEGRAARGWIQSLICEYLVEPDISKVAIVPVLS